MQFASLLSEYDQCQYVTTAKRERNTSYSQNLATLLVSFRTLDCLSRSGGQGDDSEEGLDQVHLGPSGNSLSSEKRRENVE